MVFGEFTKTVFLFTVSFKKIIILFLEFAERIILKVTTSE
jgi:hypothetical protein